MGGGVGEGGVAGRMGADLSKGLEAGGSWWIRAPELGLVACLSFNTDLLSFTSQRELPGCMNPGPSVSLFALFVS